MTKDARAYTLPKRLLRLATVKLCLIDNLDARSTANALLHLCAQFHAAPGTMGRHFFLCRESLPDHPAMDGHSEWHIRLAIDWLLSLGFIRKVDRDEKDRRARKTPRGIRKPPTLFAFRAEIAIFFPAAHRRDAAIRYGASPVCRKASPNLNLPLREVAGVHTGEPVQAPKPPRPPSAFDARMDAILAGVLAHARP